MNPSQDLQYEKLGAGQGGKHRLRATVSTGASYTDSGLLAGQIYTCVVTAYKTNGATVAESGYSATATAAPTR